MPSALFVRLFAALLSIDLVGCASAQLRMDAMSPQSEYAESSATGDAAAGAGIATDAAPTAPEAAAAEGLARLMIYNAELRMVVASIDAAMSSARSTGESLGGYVQSMSASHVTLKVPAARLNEAIAAMRRLGEVADQQIVGADVTEHMLDLRVRLETAEQMRTRLLALLDQAKEVEDALKIEQELGRVVQTIEAIKGKIRLVENQVAYSTLTVRFNSPIPQDQVRELMPFPWVRGLASEFVNGTRPASVERGWFRRGIEVALPTGYVKYYGQMDETRMMSAAGVLTRIARHENYPGGSLDFWGGLVRRALVQTRAIAVNDGERIELADGAAATLLIGQKTIGDERCGYMVAIAVDGDERVYAYEAWGPIEAFEADRDALVRSVRSMRMR